MTEKKKKKKSVRVAGVFPRIQRQLALPVYHTAAHCFVTNCQTNIFHSCSSSLRSFSFLPALQPTIPSPLNARLRGICPTVVFPVVFTAAAPVDIGAPTLHVGLRVKVMNKQPEAARTRQKVRVHV